MTIAYDKLPPHMQDEARAYVETGTPPSGFLSAVLENRKLTDVFARADDVNALRMKDWVLWLYNDIPSAAWGSMEKVDAWCESGGLSGNAEAY